MGGDKSLRGAPKNSGEQKKEKKVAIKKWVARAREWSYKGLQGAPKGSQPMGDQAQSRPDSIASLLHLYTTAPHTSKFGER